jgi:hypothetical protein
VIDYRRIATRAFHNEVDAFFVGLREPPVLASAAGRKHYETDAPGKIQAESPIPVCRHGRDDEIVRPVRDPAGRHNAVIHQCAQQGLLQTPSLGRIPVVIGGAVGRGRLVPIAQSSQDSVGNLDPSGALQMEGVLACPFRELSKVKETAISRVVSRRQPQAH